jgi:hypothetical protein
MARASSWSAARWLLVAAAGCTSGRTVVLGEEMPLPYHFGTPQIVAELAAPPARTDNPTLTGDLLEIYFTTDRVSGNGDVWFAQRASPTAPFGAPAPVTVVNTSGFETSSAISTDGLTLWFGSDRPGGAGANDVWVTSRATRSAPWSTPVNVVALNSAVDDIPRPPGQHGLVMPLASQRKDPSIYETYFAARASAGAPFGTPQLVPDLVRLDRTTVDAFLTDDGLTVFYSSGPRLPPADAGAPDGSTAGADGGGPDGAVLTAGDLYVAWRRSFDDLFAYEQPLSDLNTPGDERDPWLTPDGRTLYFTSDRDGTLNIYTAAVLPR